MKLTNILVEVLASMAEQERLTIRKRQAEGIATAKANGKHLGRPKIKSPDNFEGVYSKWKDKDITAICAMKELGLKRTSFYKLVKQYEIEKDNREGCSFLFRIYPHICSKLLWILDGLSLMVLSFLLVI